MILYNRIRKKNAEVALPFQGDETAVCDRLKSISIHLDTRFLHAC